MSPRIIVLDEAEDELAEAERWYEEQRPGLGSDFLHAVNETVLRFLEEPMASSPVPGLTETTGARRLFVKRFPYAVVFIEHGGDYWVLAFAHHKRRPGYWRHRLHQTEASK